MAKLLVMVIGSDRSWRARLERTLAMRGELHWAGAHTADRAGAAPSAAQMLWLLDGDDGAVHRLCSRPRTPRPLRLYFYRQPGVGVLRQCVQRGDNGCLDKQAAPQVILRAIRSLGTGLFLLDRALLLHALAQHAMSSGPIRRRSDTAARELPGLTLRQCEIVSCAARGLSNKQIGRQLGISPETVKTHLHHAFEREGISGRGALLAAQRSRLLGNGGPMRTVAEQQPTQQLLL